MPRIPVTLVTSVGVLLLLSTPDEHVLVPHWENAYPVAGIWHAIGLTLSTHHGRLPNTAERNRA